MRHAICVVVVFLLALGSLSAATFDRVSDEQLVQRAELIVVGHVVSSSARVVGRGLVVTDHVLAVEDVVRGTVQTTTITITVGGGALGDKAMVVPGSPDYQPGERVLALLRRGEDGTYFTVSMALGKFGIERGADGRDRLVRNLAEIDADDHQEFTSDDADEVIRALRAGTPLPVRQASRAVESNAFKTTTDKASDYVLKAGGLPVRWQGCESASPLCPTITFSTNGPQAGTADSPLAIQHAMDAWEGDTNSYVRLGLSGFNGDTAPDNDDNNDIIFNGSAGAFSGICDGTLGCGLAFAGPTHTFDSETWRSIVSGDIVIYPISYNSQKSLDTVVAHELGHTLGLNHSPSGNLMQPSLNLGRGAVLGTWDQAAMAEVYGTGLPCVPPSSVSISGGGTVSPGATKTLKANLSGETSYNPHFQWYEGAAGDTTQPVGTDSVNFTTPAINASHSYWVRVSGDCGSAVDSPAVTVQPTGCTQPSIQTQPASQQVTDGTSVTLMLSASGTTPLTIHWFEGLIPDETKPVGTNSTSFTTPVLHATTSYWARVNNSCGLAVTQQVTITVVQQCAPPTVAAQPSTLSLSPGEGATLQVTAGGTGPFTYQWFEGPAPNDAHPLANQTGPSLALQPFTQPGVHQYWVRIGNSCGSVPSQTITITVGCTAPDVPQLFAPAVSHYSMGYDVSWLGGGTLVGGYELQESTSQAFNAGLRTFVVTTGHTQRIDAHSEVTTDTRFFYRVRALSSCSTAASEYSRVASTIVAPPQPANSSSFSLSVPQDASHPFTQDYLVPGFGETANSGDTFSITVDVPWLTVFPSAGALSAGGTTVQFTINPSLLEIGTSAATVHIVRTPGTSARHVTTNGTTTVSIPFGVSKVTPVTPEPRSATPPPGTLIVPAIAHADGVGTRFQSDVRIVNASNDVIAYDIAWTPTASNGTQVGKQTTLNINGNETMSLDDIVKGWYGAGALGEVGLGTLEIRPMNGANPAATFASSRTYAISATGTLGQFIPAIGIDKFIGNIAQDPLAKISLQQIANSSAYRTNLGFVEGSGQQTQLLVKLIDGNNNIIATANRTLAPYGHDQSRLVDVFPGVSSLTDGRVEVQVVSATGKATAYASVVDNKTSDPLLVFPVQAEREASAHYVLPGVAELVNGASNFHTDMRVFNAGSTPVSVSLNYFPQAGDSTPRPEAHVVTIAPGQVQQLDNVLPSIWNLTKTGGAVTIDAPANASLVVTGRTYSRNEAGGTFGQFIPGVTSKDAVGLGERPLQVLQLEQSDQFRANLGLVEVTGNPIKVELLGQTAGKITARTEATLSGNQFMQIGKVFQAMGLSTAYGGRVSVRVIEGNGKVAAYGSVVDNRTIDPTYVPAQ